MNTVGGRKEEEEWLWMCISDGQAAGPSPLAYSHNTRATGLSLDAFLMSDVKGQGGHHRNSKHQLNNAVSASSNTLRRTTVTPLGNMAKAGTSRLATGVDGFGSVLRGMCPWKDPLALSGSQTLDWEGPELFEVHTQSQ